MWKDTLALVTALVVFGCAEAPTEARSATDEGAFRSTPNSLTAGGQVLRVAIPDVGVALDPDEVLVATGRTGSVDFSECDGNVVTAARYAVFLRGRNESYHKVHFSTDVEAGTKMSKFNNLTSCVIGGIQYQVYEVETQ